MIKILKMNNTFEFGQKINIKHRLERVEHHMRGSKFSKIWKDVDYEAEVIVIGQRTLFDGEVWWEQDAGRIFTPKSHIRALLVVENMRENPFYVRV